MAQRKTPAKRKRSKATFREGGIAESLCPVSKSDRFSFCVRRACRKRAIQSRRLSNHTGGVQFRVQAAAGNDLHDHSSLCIRPMGF
eukprot:3888067-Rhodomonas_salina.2